MLIEDSFPGELAKVSEFVPFVDLRNARMDKPELVSFHTLWLRPSWFIDVDPSEFSFTNVWWYLESQAGELQYWIDLGTHTETKIRSFPQLLERACWKLCRNTEANDYYEEASELRYWAFDSRRKESCWGWAFWKLDWWYWLTSGYGNRVGRSLLVLIAIWLGFAAIYAHRGVGKTGPNPSDGVEPPAPAYVQQHRSDFPSALAYSLAVMVWEAPESHLDTVGRILICVEKVLSPVQGALLALAVRRKFMR